MKKIIASFMVIGLLAGTASGCAMFKRNCDTTEFLTNSMCR
ncbi:hypothetical protein phiOC_p184 [Ochrobactrum phage vB_OspM_OC]|nr:hypothetical protein phiOC_p184 [Ochrobactrum phage vB_OspM_OC]